MLLSFFLRRPLVSHRMKSDTLRDLEALAYVSFSDEYQDVLVVTREVGDVRDNRGRYEVAKPRYQHRRRISREISGIPPALSMI